MSIPENNYSTENALEWLIENQDHIESSGYDVKTHTFEFKIIWEGK